MTRTDDMIEIVDAKTGAVIVCDTLAHCASCDQGVAEEAVKIMEALEKGEDYQIGGGAAAHFTIRAAPAQAA